MGTRGTTRVREIHSATATDAASTVTLVTLYRQFDSYPSGHGRELADFLFHNGKPRPICNGYTDKDAAARAFNGAGCLAARLVAHFKREIGGFYLVPEGQEEEWNYTLDVTTANGPFMAEPSGPTITVTGDGKTFGPFTPAQFRAWVKRRKH